MLRKLDYCDNLSVQFSGMAGHALCKIICDISDNGLEHGVDDIIHLVFQVKMPYLVGDSVRESK